MIKKKTLFEKTDAFSRQLIAECWKQMWTHSEYGIAMDLIHATVKMRKLVQHLESNNHEQESLNITETTIQTAEQIELMMILLERTARITNNALFLQLSGIILQLEAFLHLNNRMNRTA